MGVSHMSAEGSHSTFGTTTRFKMSHGCMLWQASKALKLPAEKVRITSLRNTEGRLVLIFLPCAVVSGRRLRQATGTSDVAMTVGNILIPSVTKFSPSPAPVPDTPYGVAEAV